MNPQQMQNCERSVVFCSLIEAVYNLIDVVHIFLDRIQIRHEQKALYRYYSRLDAAKLRDIGMHDPQNQLRVLGRYL